MISEKNRSTIKKVLEHIPCILSIGMFVFCYLNSSANRQDKFTNCKVHSIEKDGQFYDIQICTEEKVNLELNK